MLNSIWEHLESPPQALVSEELRLTYFSIAPSPSFLAAWFLNNLGTAAEIVS